MRDQDRSLWTYHLFDAARAQMLRRLHRSVEAITEDRTSSGLTSNPAELSLLYRRIEDATFITVDRLRKR